MAGGCFGSMRSGTVLYCPKVIRNLTLGAELQETSACE